MGTTIQSSATVDNYASAFESLEGRRRHEPAWLRAARSRAMDLFAGHGFPTTKEEDWRFTNLAPIAAEAFATATGDAPAALVAAAVPRMGGVSGPVLVFVDGLYSPRLSTAGTASAAMTVHDLSEYLERLPGPRRAASHPPRLNRGPASSRPSTLRCSRTARW